MTSNVPNIHLSFPLETSNSFQVLSPDFPPLQSSKSFIQASKSNYISLLIQGQSNPSTVSTLPSSSSLPYSQYAIKLKTL